MNFCSRCGSSRIIFKIPQGDSLPRYCCENCGTIHYQNPRMIVGCLPLYEKKILLAKRNIEPRKGFWNLPAGFLENNETIQEGALRELFEETKAKGQIQHVHCLYNLPKANQVYVHFLVHLDSPHFELTSESSEIAFFSEEEIPWDDMAFTSSSYALKKYFESKDSPPAYVPIGAYPEG